MAGLFLSLIFIINTQENLGTAGYLFLRINTDARSAAMATTGIANDFSQPQNSFDFLSNPASLTKTSKIGISYLNYIAQVQIGSVTYHRSLPQIFFNSVGIGIVYLNSGRIKKTDEYGNELGTFTVSYLNSTFSLSKEIIPEKLLSGVNVKFLMGSIDSFLSLGLAGDIGLRYLLPVKGLSAGLIVKNIGRELKGFTNNSDPLPWNLGVGVNYRLSSQAGFTVELHKPHDKTFQFNLGAEGWVNNYVALRLGYSSLGRYYKVNSSDLLSGFSWGLGVNYQKYKFDYSYTPMAILGHSHTFTFSFYY
jgi:hypothetical protein